MSVLDIESQYYVTTARKDVIVLNV